MWNEEEQAAINRRLGKYLVLQKLPGKHEIEEARHKEPVLLNRNWVQIKSFIKNVKVSKRRRLTQDKLPWIHNIRGLVKRFWDNAYKTNIRKTYKLIFWSRDTFSKVTNYLYKLLKGILLFWNSVLVLYLHDINSKYTFVHNCFLNCVLGKIKSILKWDVKHSHHIFIFIPRRRR